MAANQAVGALEAWIDYKLDQARAAAIGTIVSMSGTSADVELEGEQGLIRYYLPVLEQPSSSSLQIGSRVLVVFTEAHQSGGVVIGKVGGG